jgi:CubicO group peptidase (beta-lactamase class C family)
MHDTDAEFSSKAAEYMDSQVKMNRFSGSVLVAHNGKVLFSRGYGMARVESGVLNNPSTKFRVGSIAHQFIAMAVLELAEQGKLNLQDPVCTYIVECPQAWHEIKIIHLLTHTSGLSDLSVAHKTARERWALLKTRPLEFQPGQRLMFSNFGYEILNSVIEKVCPESHATYLSEHIFDPLGMHDTGYVNEKADISSCADGYRQDGSTIAMVNPACADTTGARSADPYSTVEDLYRWDRALFDGKLVSKESIEQMSRPYRDGYGFGWKVLREFQRRALVYGGKNDGFSTSIRRYPDNGAFVVVLSNLENADADKISHDLGGLVLGPPPREKKRTPEPHTIR